MSLYENKVCPVCKREFLKDDDIVVCPECGTPHHRECYSLIGHCVNKGLHKANYSYYDDQKQQENVIDLTQKSGEYYQPNDEVQSEEAKHEEEPKQSFNPFVVSDVDSSFDKDTDTIDGQSISDIAATVRINPARFVAKFKQMESTNKKAGWNWSAFIFGSFYLLYRKMYKAGIGIFVVIISLFYGCGALLFKLAPSFMEAIQSISSQSVQGVYPTNEQLMSVMNSPDVNNAMMISYGFLAILFVIHIIIGIVADYIYKGTVIGIIKKVNEQLDGGSSFSQTTVVFGGEINMSQEQMKKMYLGRKGGASFFAPMLAMLALTFII